LDAIALLASPRPSASPLLLARIADLMGHKDLATTQIYAKVEQQHLRSVVTKLTPLVPTDASLKCVTRRTNEQVDDGKLLKGNDFVEGGLELAEREGLLRIPNSVKADVIVRIRVLGLAEVETWGRQNAGLWSGRMQRFGGDKIRVMRTRILRERWDAVVDGLA
jgi:hypothetical protein